MVTIYQGEWCPYCKHVRDWIAENLNDIPLVFISVPHDRSERIKLKEISGQVFVPTLIDEETKTIIPDDDDKIIEYLSKKFRDKSPESRDKEFKEVDSRSITWLLSLETWY